MEPGDTLYGIAWRHGLDYKEIAAANGIGPPYLIRPGQRLALSAPEKPRETEPQKRNESPGEPTRPAAVRPVATASPTRAGTSIRTQRVAPDSDGAAPRPTRDPVATAGASRWRWPVPDKPLRGFGTKSKFVVYELGDGTAVRSASGGVVVPVPASAAIRTW